MIGLDELGPEGAKSFPGRRLVRDDPCGTRRARAAQEADDGRRGSGYVFGAFRPATGAAFTAAYQGRTIANGVDVLDQVDAWVAPEAERVSAVLDNRSSHRAADVLLWALAHPRWEVGFQPTSAAELNLIEPWWTIPRSLALKGRRFATWEEVWQAVAAGAASWNQHRHPFVGGRRRKRRPARSAGIACLPVAA